MYTLANSELKDIVGGNEVIVTQFPNINGAPQIVMYDSSYKLIIYISQNQAFTDGDPEYIYAHDAYRRFQ